MTALWAVHTLWTGLLLLLAGRLLESCARSLRLPLRWVWVAALGATLGLAAFTAYSTTRPAATFPGDAVAGLVRFTGADEARSSLSVLVQSMAVGIRQVIDAPAALLREHATGAVMQRAGVVFGALWFAASVALAGLLGMTLLRDRRARRSWPREVVAGERVRVAPGAGPAVAGVLRPEIVVPAWLLDAPLAEQRMVVAHEASHLRARDNLTLVLSGIARVLLPWHPVVWWMAARLRLAIELDCDARVIRDGAHVHRYGVMLVEMASRRATLPLGSVALAETKSHLERRIVAMTESTTRRALARAMTASAAAAMLVLAACEADLPTAAELEAMDVSEVEEQIAPVMGELTPLYIVDGEAVDADAAHALTPGEIARVDVVKYMVTDTGAPGRPEIRILTESEASRRALTERHSTILQRDAAAEAAATQQAQQREAELPEHTVLRRSGPSGAGFTGMVFIDGRRVEPSTLRTLSPETIESIEVLKGAAAARLYSEPEAADGVIRITTKEPGGR